MANTILLPIFNRPEFFHFVAHSIANARRAGEYRILVAAERGYSPEYVPILREMQRATGCDVQVRLCQRRFGVTPNVLEGLKAAMAQSDEYAIVLEDDVVVSRDYFETMDTLFRQFSAEDVLAFLGYGGRARKSDPLPHSPEEAERFAGYYPYGPLIPKTQFERHILPHCHTGYYEHKLGYLWKHFRDSSLKSNCPDHDGLICRILEKNKMFCVRPLVGRARHIGFHGLHRQMRDDSFQAQSLEQKIQAIEKVLDDPSAMGNLGDYQDYLYVDEDHAWKRLVLVNAEHRLNA